MSTFISLASQAQFSWASNECEKSIVTKIAGLCDRVPSISHMELPKHIMDTPLTLAICLLDISKAQYFPLLAAIFSGTLGFFVVSRDWPCF